MSTPRWLVNNRRLSSSHLRLSCAQPHTHSHLTVQVALRGVVAIRSTHSHRSIPASSPALQGDVRRPSVRCKRRHFGPRRGGKRGGHGGGGSGGGRRQLDGLGKTRIEGNVLDNRAVADETAVVGLAATNCVENKKQYNQVR